MLNPSDALKSFKIQPGFEIQLVAAEPLVETPVAMTFDADGRMWVLEMRGYMPDPDGKGEDQPKGRVSVLEDTDGDGRMDKSTIFAEGLVMPRALALVQGGLLVAEPPNLWFFKDTNGDFKSDQKSLVATNYGSQVNPEHTSNGLMPGMDGWIYSANHTTKIRFAHGEWVQEPNHFSRAMGHFAG